MTNRVIWTPEAAGRRANEKRQLAVTEEIDKLADENAHLRATLAQPVGRRGKPITRI